MTNGGGAAAAQVAAEREQYHGDLTKPLPP
jgi:hypothetical protein